MVKSPFKASHLEYLSKSDWPEAVADDKEQPEPIENDEVAEAAEALEVVTSKKKRTVSKLCTHRCDSYNSIIIVKIQISY